MPENPAETNTYSRKACFEDFFDDSIPKTSHDKNYNKNDRNNIEKNQQEFGNRKRIKP